MKEKRTMKNILVVDDQPHLQELFSEELREEGFGVMGVKDGESATRCLRKSEVDLVLLDLYLDGFEGWNVLSDIKTKHPQLPVLIFTAYDSYANDPRASQADGYMVKSFDALHRLKEKIVDLVRP
jgi:DNA-binding response OmpR family regulator